MTGGKAKDELEKAASQIQWTCTYLEVKKKGGGEPLKTSRTSRKSTRHLGG